MCEALKGKEWLKATLLSSPDQDIFPCKMAQLLDVSLHESTCVVSDGYHRTVAVLARDALDTFLEEFPGHPLSGTMVNIQKAAFEVRSEKRDFVLAVKTFEWIGGRPLDTIGEPADLKAEPEVVTLLQIFLNHDGDEDRIPASQQAKLDALTEGGWHPDQRLVSTADETADSDGDVI